MSAQAIIQPTVVIKRATLRRARNSWRSSMRQPAFPASRPRVVSAPCRQSAPMVLSQSQPVHQLSERLLVAVALLFVAALLVGAVVVGVQFLAVTGSEASQGVADLVVAAA